MTASFTCQARNRHQGAVQRHASYHTLRSHRQRRLTRLDRQQYLLRPASRVAVVPDTRLHAAVVSSTQEL
ncbi:hypothetical protein EON64_15305 [archaeon]|nr:MAG: hypothetical protein EON64_15305 [archaeon]